MRGSTWSDRVLVTLLAVFCFTSWVMEMYIVLGVDLAGCTDPLGRLFYFYASRWDPIFLDPPVFLWLMCCCDAFVFGSCYIALIVGFYRKSAYVRPLAIAYASAILYSTIIYFGVEFISERERANLFMVSLVNAPYVLVPLWLLFRVRRSPVFPGAAQARGRPSPTWPDLEALDDDPTNQGQGRG